MDPELKELLAKAKEAIGNYKELNGAITEIRAWGEEKGRLAEAEKAANQVNDLVKEIQANFDKKMAAISRQIRDVGGSYRGITFASVEEARTFTLSVLRNVPDFRARATEMLEADHKDFLERAGTPHGGETSLVAHEHSTRIQRLTEDYGSARDLLRVQPVDEATGTFHRRKSGLRARKTKVRTKVPETSAAWEPINWGCDDFDILVSYPMSLSDDMIVPFAELLAQEMALGYAIAEDEDTFIGDGSDLFDNIVGFVPRLKTINGVDDGGGLVLASGNLWSEIVEDDILKMIGQARYVRPGQGRLVCSNEFFWQVLAKITAAKGGVTRRESEEGPRFMFNGIDAEIVPVMPRAQGNSQIPLLYGDFELAGTLFDRQAMEIRQSREVRFESKEVVMLATERIDINVQTLGEADEAGPVVGLITQAA